MRRVRLHSIGPLYELEYINGQTAYEIMSGVLGYEEARQIFRYYKSIAIVADWDTGQVHHIYALENPKHHYYAWATPLMIHGRPYMHNVSELLKENPVLDETTLYSIYTPNTVR